MERLRRQLLLPASDIFSDCNRTPESREAVAIEDGREIPTSERRDDWNLFLRHCEALLKASGVRASPCSISQVATKIAQLSNNCYRAGFDECVRQSVNLSAERARIAKLKRAHERGQIVRRAIIAVCTKQKVTPTASDKFAVSIHADVIAAARQLGLTDVKSGLSPRSLQRHIAALLKDMRMP